MLPATKICEFCHQPYTLTSASTIKEQRFCSRKCGCKARRARNGTLNQRCKHCDKPFDSYIQGQSYCSHKCYTDSRIGKSKTEKVVKPCEYCGKPFSARCNAITKTRRFCSRQCRGIATMLNSKNHNWKGNSPDTYGPGWERQRNAARKRDGNTCQMCGTKRISPGLDVHHIVPRSEFQVEELETANHLDNLITLCHPCHMKVELGTLELSTTPTKHF